MYDLFKIELNYHFLYGTKRPTFSCTVGFTSFQVFAVLFLINAQNPMNTSFREHRLGAALFWQACV